MFDEIRKNEELFAITRLECCENDYKVSIDEMLQDSDNVILKIDAYFSSNNIHNPPPSVDCLIIVKCSAEDCYNIYLVELKNISRPQGFRRENIVSKFQTTIDIFLKENFGSIFLGKNYCNFKCYFVTNPYNFSGKQSDYDEHINANGLRLDYFSAIEPFEFEGIYAAIEPKLPNPTITPC